MSDSPSDNLLRRINQAVGDGMRDRPGGPFTDLPQEDLEAIFTACLSVPDGDVVNWGAAVAKSADTLWRVEPRTVWERKKPDGKWEVIES